ncbi:MAG: hypothetical protein ABUJ92_15520, partial [Desulfobacterales bacterium]
QGGVDQFIDEIISKLPLKERVSIANIDKKHIEILQSIFELFILEKTGSEIEDEEYNNIMNELWKRLQETHKLRIVK